MTMSPNLAQKFCFTFLDRVKASRKRILSAHQLYLIIDQLKADYPFNARRIIWKGECIGTEFVFLDGSTAANYFKDPQTFHTEPGEGEEFLPHH